MSQSHYSSMFSLWNKSCNFVALFNSFAKRKTFSLHLHEKSSRVRDTRTQRCEGTSINSWLHKDAAGEKNWMCGGGGAHSHRQHIDDFVYTESRSCLVWAGQQLCTQTWCLINEVWDCENLHDLPKVLPFYHTQGPFLALVHWQCPSLKVLSYQDSPHGVIRPWPISDC